MSEHPEFDEWIAKVEDGLVGADCPGLLSASLEHRAALRLAFYAGFRTGYLYVPERPQ